MSVTRLGVTLVEVLVAMLLLLLVVVLVFTAVRQGTRVEGASTRDSQLALQQAFLYETLSSDLHSSFDVKQPGSDQFVIHRYEDTGHDAKEVKVVYKIDEKNLRIVREVDGEKPTTFDFDKIMPERMKFRLEIEKVP